MVRSRRGARLVEDPELFTGLFWTGTRGVELGLVDSLGDMRSVLKARYGDKTRLRLVAAPRGFLARRLGSFGTSHDGERAAGIAHSAADGLIAAVEERGLWGRYGL
jgi:ClpP class serine protease